MTRPRQRWCRDAACCRLVHRDQRVRARALCEHHLVRRCKENGSRRVTRLDVIRTAESALRGGERQPNSKRSSCRSRRPSCMQSVVLVRGAHVDPIPPGSVNRAVVSSVPAAESNRRTVTCGPLCTSKSKCEARAPPRRRTGARQQLYRIRERRVGADQTVRRVDQQPARDSASGGRTDLRNPAARNGHRRLGRREVRRVDFTTSSFPPHCRSDPASV